MKCALGSLNCACTLPGMLNCPSCALGAKESSKLHVYEQEERNLAHKNKCELYLKISLGDQCGSSSLFFQCFQNEPSAVVSNANFSICDAYFPLDK